MASIFAYISNFMCTSNSETCHILNRKFHYCNVLGISLLGVAGGVAVGVVVGVAVGVAVALVVCIKCAFSVTGSFIIVIDWIFH